MKVKALVLVAVLVLVVGIVLLGHQTLGAKAQRVDPRVAAIWHKHEAVFQEALQGHQENDNFDEACTFFEETTGIQLHLNFFTFGMLPTKESGQDFARIRAWYRVNKYRLYWDERTNAVKVRPR